MSDTPLQWTITVDYAPGQNWEAAIQVNGDYGPGGYEASDVGVLLAHVARDLHTEATTQGTPDTENRVDSLENEVSTLRDELADLRRDLDELQRQSDARDDQ